MQLWRAPPDTRTGTLIALFGVSASAFAVMAGLGSGESALAICQVGVGGRPTAQTLEAGALSRGWLLMIAAMTPPLLLSPISHVLASSPARRRLRAAALFCLGYATIWLATGLVLLPAALLLDQLLGARAATVLAILTAVWLASPWAQIARNRCHRVHRIGIIGWRADRDCVVFGIETGEACLGVCWPMMMTCLLVPDMALAAMLGFTVFAVVDRSVSAKRPRWRMPPGLTVLVTWALKYVSMRDRQRGSITD